jgi:formylglycine-generating enzyme required for sulfatase activity
MVWVPGGEFVMGADDQYPEEAPAHRVVVHGFWMDRYPVTNERFARFVAATGHVTLAEQAPDPADYPGARPELLVAASAVFRKPGRDADRRDIYSWWIHTPGASWRHPRGPQSSLKGFDQHPVLHLAWPDVEAYAAWAGQQLPTEAEWERAARGGREPTEFAWGDELMPGGRHLANVWQGEFPVENLGLDGYEHTSPMRAFPPNPYGLFDMIGNVWEWTVDWYQDHGRIAHACCTVANPRGPAAADSVDPALGDAVPRKVMKGGSHLCAPNYCRRYRPAARMPQAVDTSTSHLGFRCVVRPGSGPIAEPGDEASGEAGGEASGGTDAGRGPGTGHTSEGAS